MRSSRLLLPLTFLSLVATAIGVAACSGGGSGHGIDPCCAATGQTEVPPTAFAPSANAASASGYFARPFILSSESDCVTLDATGKPVLPLAPTFVGKKVPVDASGRYTLDIDATAIGRTVYVVISDASDNPLGIGATATESAALGDSYHLGPITFLSGTGESTLESAVWCSLLSAGGTGDLHFYDVKGFVTSAMAASFTGDLSGLTASTATYGDAIGDLTHLPTTLGVANASQIEQALYVLREKAETQVDECLDGVTPDANSGIDCATQDGFRRRRAELYRAWRFLHATSADGISALPFGPPPIALSFAQAVGFSFGVATSGGTTAFEVERRAQILRFEAIRKTINDNATALGLSTSGAVATDLAQLREASVEYTNPQDFLGTSSSIANDLLTNLQQDPNSTLNGSTSCIPGQILNSNGIPDVNAFIQNAPPTIALDQILVGLFTPNPAATSTVVSDVDAQLDNATNCPSLSGTAPATVTQRHAWRDIIVAASFAATPYPK